VCPLGSACHHCASKVSILTPKCLCFPNSFFNHPCPLHTFHHQICQRSMRSWWVSWETLGPHRLHVVSIPNNIHRYLCCLFPISGSLHPLTTVVSSIVIIKTNFPLGSFMSLRSIAPILLIVASMIQSIFPFFFALDPLVNSVDYIANPIIVTLYEELIYSRSNILFFLQNHHFRNSLFS
jgi:hypothetical protein